MEKKDKAPKCHFTPMKFTFADDGPGEQVIFWECKYCGHTKEIERHLVN